MAGDGVEALVVVSRNKAIVPVAELTTRAVRPSGLTAILLASAKPLMRPPSPSLMVSWCVRDKRRRGMVFRVPFMLLCTRQLKKKRLQHEVFG